MTKTPRDESGWTTETYAAANDARWQAQERFEAERDRRYREVDEARAEAVRIKELANQEALRLARAAQEYRDERDNRLREQITEERSEYATRNELHEIITRFESSLASFKGQYEAAHKPLADYVTSQLGRERGVDMSTKVVYSVLVLAVSTIAAVLLYVHR